MTSNDEKPVDNATFAMRLLGEYIPGLAVETAGGVVPFQSWGDIGDGYRFYYRDRSGFASLNIAVKGAHVTEPDPDDKWSRYSNGKEDIPAGTTKSLYRASLNEYDSPEQYFRGWVSNFLTLLEALKPLPDQYEFPNLAEGDPAPVLYGWGWTAEEAYQDGLESRRETMEDPRFEALVPVYAEAKYRPEDGVLLNPPREFPEEQPVFLTSVPEEWRMSDGSIMVPHEQGRRIG